MSDNKPKPIPRKTPGDQASGGKKKGGMTMREQIAARKQAEMGGAGAKPAARPAAKSAGKPAPRAAAKGKPTARSAQPASKVAPKKAGAPAAKAATAAASGDGAPKAGRTARPSSRSGARKGGSSRGARAKDEGGDDNGGTTRGRRARPEPKKKSPVPIIAAAVIVLGGAGAYFGGVFDGDKTEAAESGDGTTTTAGVGAAAAGAGEDAADQTPTGDGAVADEGAGDAAAGEGSGAGDGAAEESTADAPAKAAAKAKEAEGESEADQAKAKTDLSGLKPFGKPPGATDEEWATLQEKAAEFFDPFAGAAGGRAKKKLIEAGQMAWPAILNEMIKLDPDDPEQNRMGFRAADALDRARGSDTGRAFDWRTSQNSATGEMKAKDLYYNKRLIILFHEGWTKVLEDPAHWSMYDKTDAAAEAKERAAAKAKEKSDEFDDLDLGDIEID